MSALHRTSAPCRVARAALLAAAAATACAGAPRGGRQDTSGGLVVETRFQMGTVTRIVVAAPDDTVTRGAIAGAFSTIDDVVAVMSEWEAPSDVSRVNAAAGGEPVRVDSGLLRILETARSVSAASGGAFDVTWAAFRDVWCFADACAAVPSELEIERARALVDWRAVELDAGAGTVRLARPGMQLGLGGIAKGYAIDRAAAALRRAGLDAFVVSASGDIYAAGQNGERPWRVAIRNPRGDTPIDVVALRDRVVTTSGDYERYFEVEGVRYHHLIDPRTGQPARGLVQVSVVAADPTVADALATAAFVMGPARGVALVEAWPDAEGLFVDVALRVHRTREWPGTSAATHVVPD